MEQKVTAYLRRLKDQRGYTQQQIADESGVALGTVAKYMAGIDDEGAGFDVVRKMAYCMGGSLDELAGIRTDDHKTDEGTDQAYKAVIAGLEARLDEKDERIAHRGQLAEDEQQRAAEVLAYERRRARIAMTISYIVMGLFVLVVFIDWMIPTVGWIRR